MRGMGVDDPLAHGGALSGPCSGLRQRSIDRAVAGERPHRAHQSEVPPRWLEIGNEALHLGYGKPPMLLVELEAIPLESISS